VAARHWDDEALKRLGKLLTVRREELDPRFHVRKVFAAERGIHLRKAADLENGWRKDFPPLTLKDEVAPAYGVTFESVLDALNEGGDLVAAPGAPAHRPPRALRSSSDASPAAPSRLAAVPPASGDDETDVRALLDGDGVTVPEMPPALAAAIAVHIPAVREAVERAARADAQSRGIPVAAALREVPRGAAVFPADEEFAALWDQWRQDSYPGGVRFGVALLIWGAAFRRAQDEFRAHQAGGTASGLAAVAVLARRQGAAAGIPGED
jgi:hypothetical protein